ncbi:hAT family dimerization protein [Rhizoctonia solani]|uniref:HAT family dimerization protein n=1 Tax=Rhizoctonia solani TaxID=456999 RepID=A0A8H8NWB3_9AGAM|nr:hAT family dimerization protein [Rhizoctonia solani]QRW20585.1 hAT family dimerization protein [Rhizoctonia solani]
MLPDPVFANVALVTPEKELQRQIKLSLDQDKSLEEILQFLQNKSKAPPSIKRAFKDYDMEAGLLFYQGQIVVPDVGTLRMDLLRIFHNSPLAGHPGRQCTLELVSRNYYWPGIRADTYWHVDSCEICQQIRKPKYASIPPQPLELPVRPWQHVSYDMIVDLPKDGSHNSILVIVDSFTKYSIFVKCSKKLKAPKLAELFLEHVWKRHGMPEKTILDRGRVFNNKFLQALYKRLGIDPHFSLAYHPQSNGQTEQVNPSIEHFLRAYSGVNQRDWTKWLPMAEFAYNNAVHSSMGKTPFKALYGWEPSLTPSNIPTNVPEADDLAKTMEAQWKEVGSALQQSKQWMIARESGAPVEFKVGEEVWLDAKNVNLKTLSPKLMEQRLGPFKVIKRSPTALTDLNYLQLCVSTTSSTDDKRAFENCPPPITVDGEEEYEVEGITDMEERNGKWFFRVKWKGYGPEENTWEPRENLKNAGKILKKYEEEIKKKALGAAKALRGGAVLNPPNEPNGLGPDLGVPSALLPAVDSSHTSASFLPPDHGIQICAPLNLTPAKTEIFQAKILRLFIANNIALCAIDSVETWLFFNQYFPGAPLPTRQALAGQILKEAVWKLEENMVKAVYGKMATGLSNGWKDKRKRALLAYMANVDATAYTVGIKDILALPKTAENHLKVVKEAIKQCKEDLGMNIVGWVSDAGGDLRGMRICLGKEHPELLLFDCWAHQIQLVVGDVLKLKNDLVAAGNNAQEIAKWFILHSQALGLLHNEQVKATGRSCMYTVPNLTCWTSHYITAQGLLDDRGPLQATVALHHDRMMQIGSRDPERTKRVLAAVEQPEFWRRLGELTSYLRPLAIALNIAQAADTRLYHILVTLGRLYQLFDDPNIDPEDAFILAIFFHPYIRCRLFSPNSPDFCANALYTVVQRVFERVFQKASESGLFEAFMSYYNWTNEFSAEAWHLKEYSDMYKNEGKDINLDAIWSTLPCPGTVNTGRHQLACLARLILSIVANSAGCERLFSRMGNIHTKLRNRFNFKRVHDIATVAMDIDAQHQAAGLTRKRTRRHFGTPQPPPALRTASETEEPTLDLLPDPPFETIPNNDSIDSGDEEEEEPGEQNLTTLATQFNQALDEDSDGDEELPVPSAVSSQTHTRPRRLRLYFSKAHAIPLSEVFNFSGSVEGVDEGLGVFWKFGVSNLAKERDVYEAIASMRE